MSRNVYLKEDLRELGQQVKNDATTGSSDKSFTVPVGEEWEVVSVFAILETALAVGNRQMAVEAQDALGNVLARAVAGAVQVASLTQSYTFAGQVSNLASFVLDNLTTALPSIKLGPDMVLRVYDLAEVATASDNLTVNVLIGRRRV